MKHFVVISLRLAAVILTHHFCGSNTQREKNSDKNYSFQFVLTGMSLMDILSFTDTGATGLVLDLYS